MTPDKKTKIQEQKQKMHFIQQQSIANNEQVQQVGLQQRNLTAGKILTKKIKEQLKQQEFLQVFSQLQLQELKNIWQVIQNEQLSFDELQKRLTLKNLKKFVMKHQKTHEQNPIFVKILNFFINLKEWEKTVHIDRLKAATVIFFQLKFHQRNLLFIPKIKGIQIGFKIVINNKAQYSNYNSSHTIQQKQQQQKQEQLREVIYYVKTHSNGRIRGDSITNKPQKVSFLQLLYYKVFQFMHYGPEAMFYGRNLFDLYICTLDLNHQKQFVSYEQIKQKPQFHQKLIPSTQLFKNIVQLWILQKIFNITDCLSNSSNFGFEIKKNNICIKCLDFRIIHQCIKLKCKDVQNILYFPEKQQQLVNLIQETLFQQQKKKFFQIVKDFIETKMEKKRVKNILDASQQFVLNTLGDKNIINQVPSNQELKQISQNIQIFKKEIVYNIDLFYDLLNKPQYFLKKKSNLEGTFKRYRK